MSPAAARVWGQTFIASEIALPRSASLTMVCSAKLLGVGRPSSAPFRTTKPFRKSISVGLPRARSCAVEENCVGIAAGIFAICWTVSSGRMTPHPRATATHCDEFVRPFDFGHRAVRDVRHGRQGVVSAVRDELHPLHLFDVVGDRGWNAGGFQRVSQRLAARRRPDDQLSAPVMFDVARPGHFCADIDDSGDDEIADDRAETLRVVDAILQAQDDRSAIQLRGEGCPCKFRVG